MNELYIRYLDTEPIEVQSKDCMTVAALIVKAKMEFHPALTSVPLYKLTLHHYDGTKLKAHMKIAELTMAPFVNNGDTPLLIRSAEDSKDPINTSSASQVQGKLV
jgi:hypothetical protein